MYTPLAPPSDTAGIPAFLQNELGRIAAALTARNDVVRFRELGVAPSKYQDGDLLYANGSDLNLGSGEGLYVRLGGAWVNLGASGVTIGPAFRATQTSDQSILNITYTKVSFGTETFDTDGCFATGRFTPDVEGYYECTWSLKMTATTMGACLSVLYKNGTKYTEGSYATPINHFGVSTGSDLIHLNGTTDYVEVFAYISGTGTLQVLNDAGASHFSGHLARAA